MKRYTPSLERVWDEWHRRERARKHRAARIARGLPEKSRTPDNSEPWLPHEPRTLDDLLSISAQVREYAEAWKAEFKISPQVAVEAALKNPRQGVRSLVLETLREFAAAHNPFAREILQSLGEDPA